MRTRRFLLCSFHAGTKGFSIYELLITLAIFGILVSIAIPAVKTYQDESNINQAKSDILEIQAVVDKFFILNNRFPDNLDEINMQTKRDPWGKPYYYTNVSTAVGYGGGIRKDKKLKPVNSDYDLFSMGKDGESTASFTNSKSFDDIVRCNNGSFIGLVIDY